MNIAARPPIGFIVEGFGEYEAYPALTSRIAGAAGFHIPRVNAKGFGGITSGLSENMDDLVRLYHPYTVIVTLDLVDVIRRDMFADCAEVRESIEAQLRTWAKERANRREFQPLPETCVVVIQVPKFESWWLADPQSLLARGLFEFRLDECEWSNVDSEVPNPARWLEDRLKSSINMKSQSLGNEILCSHDLARMVSMSRSFQKFEKEVRLAYERWLRAVTANP